MEKYKARKGKRTWSPHLLHLSANHGAVLAALKAKQKFHRTDTDHRLSVHPAVLQSERL